MSDDVKLIITGTFGVIVLAWVLTHASQVGDVTTSLASGYSKAVGALQPTNG